MRVTVLLLLLGAISLLAQNPVVSGRITDSSGAVIPGARVQLTNSATAIAASAETNGDGYYVLPPVQPGPYNITASATGFKEARIDGFRLEIGQSRSVNLQLSPGEVREAITITDAAPLITANRADRGSVVENKFLMSIPLNVRNPYLLLANVPGVTMGRLAGDNTASQSTTNNFRINGGRGSTSEILIDGAANTGTYNNQVSAMPQLDSVQEFKVNTSPYAAEFGRTGGGVVSFSIKSGTNTLHGTFHEFLRNSVLDAAGFNSNRAGLTTKPTFQRNQFGFTSGGPVLIPKLYSGKNRTFWFASYEGLRQRSLNPYTGTVPATAERNGDFSRTLDTNGAPFIIYDPRTTRLDPDRPAGTTRYIRSVFPGNAIPASLIHPVASKLLPYYPAATQRGLGQSDINNYFVAAANALDGNRVDARVDHQISAKHSFFARYNWFQNINAQPLVFGHIASPVETPNRIPGINWVGNHTWSIGPGAIFQQHFSLAQSETNRTPLSLDFDQKSLGLPANVVDPQRVKYFPVYSIGGLTQVGVTGTGYNAVKSRTWQYNGSLTLLRGRHTFKMGGDWRRFPVTIDQSSPLSISASGSFTAGPNPQSAAARTGRGLADLMLGIAQVRYTLRPLESHVHPYYAFYFQDEWKLRPNVTLTVGMRYSLELPRTEANNQYVFLDLSSSSPLEGKVPGVTGLRGGVGFAGANGNRTQIADRKNWDPRIGLAWEWNPKTVIRTGFGIFTSSIAPNTDSSLGFQQTTSSLVSEADGVTPLYNLSNPLPGGFLPATGNSLGLSTNLGQGVSGPVRQQRLPYQAQWSFDVQRQLPWKTVIEAGYAGSSGIALPAGVQYNQIPDSALALGTQLNATVNNPFFGIITDSTSTLSRPTIQRGQLLRPYPQFTGMSASQAPVGHSTYHGLQTRVERRFDAGLALLFAYTHSKLIDNVGDFGTFLGPAGFNNSNCFSCDRSVSFYDIPDVLRLSLRYELPFGVGKPRMNRGPMARIAGGWSTGVYFTWDNGTPVQVTGPNDSNSFGGSQRPNATGQPAVIANKEMVDGGLYFNPAAFVRAPQFTFGNASRNLSDVRIPGTKNWDLLIEKRISFTERMALDFRTELFNAFNNVVFAGPQTNVTSADFGRIRLSQANVPRQIQFGLRFSY
ncbi:MAG: carboxypeptidase regulatory-like domain-containing protein [Acidobacteria bacterium]|nr:carboxypeptidase regulatory-like domain-containing protein [Acidobacteriota bacterium]